MDEAGDGNSTDGRWSVTVEIEAKSLQQAHIAMIRYVAVGQRWDQLQDKLDAINKAADAPQADERSLCSATLTAHIDFHDGDPWALEADSARMLKRMRATLHDIEQGVLRDLVKPRKVSHRASNSAVNRARGVMLFVHQQITQCGVQKGEAAKRVAGRLQTLGVHVTPEEILNRRRRLSRQPQDTQNQYHALRQARLADTAQTGDKETVEDLLELLRVARDLS